MIFLPALAGCLEPPGPPALYVEEDGYIKDKTGLDPNAWPDLNGTTLNLLDNGAFAAFDTAAGQFEKLTGVKVTKENGGDGVKAMNTLAASAASGQFDIIYGIDNALLGKAIRDKILEPYRPALVDRIRPEFLFFPQNGTFYATPVDHGYVAINVDADNPALDGVPVRDLADVRHYADQFVTENPTISTPGLGFLLTTIVAFGEESSFSPNRYDWHDYWTDLFTGSYTDRDLDGKISGCVLVVDDWTTAYVQHFSGGYGASESGGGQADKAIVTSYTESPAYEKYFDPTKENLAQVLTKANTTFHQIQTMAIAKGTKNPVAAQAWIEFTLTDFFQKLAAPEDGVYPVVPGISVRDTYGGIDPAPGTFRDARMSYETITINLERWLSDWTALREKYATCPV